MSDTIGSGRRADAASLVLIGDSPEMLDAVRAAALVAGTTATVIIRGEPGTGKELLARFVHERSRRRGGQFVAVDCAACADQLGASIEQARGGTLYLDEVAGLTAAAQVHLLHVLDARGNDDQSSLARADVRFVAGTARDLGDEVAAGRFRADLYYRLAVVELSLPPLRRRGDDVRMLAEYFVGSFACAHGRYAFAIARETLTLLRSHPWPGNVRQLKDALERAASTAVGPLILPADLPAETMDTPVAFVGASFKEFDIASLEQLERQHIERVVAATGSDLRQAAQLLGIARVTLQRKLHEYRFG